MITGKALVSDPRIKKVDLTGGTAGGRAIGEVVGKNLASYTAELGGKAPILVFGSSFLLFSPQTSLPARLHELL
jgi:acyl-CoA reductase-like NAD-dependent aldehyde dehydrogenase